jgi:hypothetical protein
MATDRAGHLNCDRHYVTWRFRLLCAITDLQEVCNFCFAECEVSELRNTNIILKE